MESSDLSTRLTPDRLQPAAAAREVVSSPSQKDADGKNRRRPAAEQEESLESQLEDDSQHQIDRLA